ncbi:hypothetical protein WOB59_12505 [Methylocystis sp. IM4]|uniref:hypothetical protein n=1 Tax=Methylocystis sp. IM4 TaxID=3136560 RepID=UPI00311A7DE3
MAENHSAQDNGDVIRAYLDRLAAREAAALETKGLEKFVRLKAQELYWTVSRLLRTLRVKLFPSSVARGGRRNGRASRHRPFRTCSQSVRACFST